MSKVQMLRALVKQRLTAAAEEIFGLFERTIAEYEEELCRSKEENHRQRHLLDSVFNPEDSQQLLVTKEQIPQQQQDWRTSLDQDDSGQPQIKEEQEELWTSQEDEQLPELENNDVIKLKLARGPVKSEDVKEKNREAEPPESSYATHMKTEADGGDRAGPEPDPNLDLHAYLHPYHDEFATSDPAAELGSDWKEAREPQSGLNFEIFLGEKTFSCFDCEKTFDNEECLKSHLSIHTGQKTFSCSICNKCFTCRRNLRRHERIHTGEKPYSCPFCIKRFTQRVHLNCHLRLHTGEKPFSCSVCQKCFACRRNLWRHTRIHTGEKCYGCSVCGKRYTQKSNLKNHMAVHTGEKMYKCGICGKGFNQKSCLKTHRCTEEAEHDITTL
ncbi:zinc finger protein 501-like [Thalassophryne amazonica]|uniref:zinc finger protein 501-like n=1 Tax=Thalassophryne amazonica TaxID=390379 RepID=UPI00147125EF|nr:zinc finger protein 501-like [Thalassophryne amazonica]